MQVSLANQEVECDLIAQEVESVEYRGTVSSTYTVTISPFMLTIRLLTHTGLTDS